MTDIVRAALPIVGAIVFGPWGAIIGGILAPILFPVEGPKGPRLNELNVQHSTVGAPVPITYGTVALAGNIIWSGGLQEVEHEGGGGGKKGGGAPSSFTYTVDVAVGICEGPISGLRRVWADADCIFDARDDATIIARYGDTAETAEYIAKLRVLSAQLDFELYLGTDDQLPDPTIQSYENAPYPYNVTPAFRGLAYIVFPTFDTANYGNRIPNFRFEVFTEGAETECGQYSQGFLLPWNDGLRIDPRLDDGAYEYSHDGVTWFDNKVQAVGGLSFTAYSGVRNIYYAEVPHGFTQFFDINAPHSNCYPVDLQDKVTIYWYFNSLNIAEGTGSCDPIASGGGLTLGPEIIGRWGTDTVFRWSGEYSGGGSYLAGNGFWVVDSQAAGEGAYFQGQSQPGSYDLGGGNTLQYLLDVPIQMRRVVQPPEPCENGVCVEWVSVSGTFKALQAYTTSGGYVTKYPVNPILPSTDPLYNDQDYWEAAYAQALADGEPIASGLVYGVDYPVSTSTAYRADCTTVEVDCVPMAQIVADLCRRAGLRTDTSSQIDVSDLTTCVPGYIVGRQMSAREAMAPLRIYGLWDAVESDAILRFVERGHPIVATLTDDDLGAHENGAEAPSKVVTTRIQEKDLPRRVRLHFANFEHDHEPSEQAASRITTEAVNELDVEVAVSMTPDYAAQLADITLRESWVSRNTYSFVLGNEWLGLEPTDCPELPVDGQWERVRIVSMDYSIGGLLKIDAVRDDGDGYTSTVIATPGTPSGGAPGSTGGGPVCPTGMVILDIPCIDPTHAADAGYYVALYGECDSWACAEVQRSNDGGLTYARVARTDLETTVGEILTITGPATDPTLPGDSPAYDDTNFITVNLFEGTLSSITDEQIAAGQNLAAVGQDGAWVIIQFKTATLDTGDQWTLTDLIWGLNDTEHLLGTTGDGDTFVLLSDSGLLRIPELPDAIGVEKQLKAVTCGQALDDADAVNFTTWGLCYQRPCTAVVLSCSLTEPPVSPADGDAYLLPIDTSLTGVWATHAGEVATWSNETDSWVYCTPVPGTVIHCGDEDVDVIPPGGGDPPLPAPWGPANATYITEDDETARLPNSLRLAEGTGIAFTKDTSGGVLTIDATASGNTTATYVTGVDETADLPNSLLLQGEDGITVDVNASTNTIVVGLEEGSGGYPDATYVTATDETATLPNSAQLVGDNGITVDYNASVNQIVISADSSGGVSDGDYGDITVSASGTVWTIDPDAVTYAKIQDVSATDRILGRDTAGPGIVEELTLSQVLDFIGSATQGDILYRGSSAWSRLGAGTSGQFLKTLGSGANPAWATVSGIGPVSVLNTKQRYDLYNDLESVISVFATALTGSGAITSTVTYQHPGTVVFATGATAASTAFLGYGTTLATSQPMIILHATDELVIEYLFKVSDAQTVTHQYETYMGGLDNIGAGSDGITFGNKWSGSADVWFIRAVINAAVTTANAATGPTPGQWHLGKLVCTTAQIELFIDGSSVATLSTGIPTTGFRPMMGIAKTAGSGVDRQLQVDFYHFYQDWDTDRHA